MFEAATSSGSESQANGDSYWAQVSQATSSYFSSERMSLLFSAGIMCVSSVSELAALSVATVEVPPVSAYAALATAMEFSGCVAYSIAGAVAPQNQLQALSDTTALTSPLALSAGAIGAMAGEQYFNIGKSLGSFLDNTISYAKDFNEFKSILTGNDLNLRNYIGDLSKIAKDAYGMSNDNAEYQKALRDKTNDINSSTSQESTDEDDDDDEDEDNSSSNVTMEVAQIPPPGSGDTQTDDEDDDYDDFDPDWDDDDDPFDDLF